MAFAEPRLVCAKNQWNMGKCRQRRTERLIQQNLFRSIRYVVGSADDVSDAEIDIIRDDAQVIGRAAIGAQ